MPKTLGYMITWTTYGTWLPGDRRGYVKSGKILPADNSLSQIAQSRLFQPLVKLSGYQRKIAANATFAQAERLSQSILALSVGSTHIHIVAEYISKPISQVVSCYKNAARLELSKSVNSARVWTSGYDKRYCFDKQSLQKRVAYVLTHNKSK